jgi:hypothetical protein
MQKSPVISLRVYSGGQTGVDRAALDVAIESDLEHGGWCPQGRRAEDGSIPLHYHLRETPEQSYSCRTRRNVEDSDGTLIIYRDKLEGGTELTAQLANELRKPVMIVDLAHPVNEGTFKDWLKQHRIGILNIAGPRESKQPGIYQQSVDLLRRLLS